MLKGFLGLRKALHFVTPPSGLFLATPLPEYVTYSKTVG